MSPKRRSFVGPSGAWSVAAWAGAFAGIASRAATKTALSHSNRLRCKGMGFITNAPEVGFLPGTTDLLHGRLTLGNRFDVIQYSLRQGFIPPPRLPPEFCVFSG